MKVSLTFYEAFWRGVGCNWLVCLAVWLAISGRDTVSKIFALYFPLMAFVASGFEHSIANMYLIPIGLLLKSNPAVVGLAGLSGKIGTLTWQSFLTNNLLPVTLGNIVGGALFVGGSTTSSTFARRSPERRAGSRVYRKSEKRDIGENT